MSATDVNNSDVFSLRIVSIDNYMRAPVLGLDACYSEFRADAVKQVSTVNSLSSNLLLRQLNTEFMEFFFSGLFRFP